MLIPDTTSVTGLSPETPPPLSTQAKAGKEVGHGGGPTQVSENGE